RLDRLGDLLALLVLRQANLEIDSRGAYVRVHLGLLGLVDRALVEAALGRGSRREDKQPTHRRCRRCASTLPALRCLPVLHGSLPSAASPRRGLRLWMRA